MIFNLLKKFNYINCDFHFWMLQVILFFSLFAFSAYNAKAELPSSKSSQTELVFSKKSFSKNIISLEKAKSLLTKSFVFLQQIKFLKVDLIQIQQCLSVKYKVAFQKVISFQKPIFIFSTRIISSTLDLDIPTFSFR